MHRSECGYLRKSSASNELFSISYTDSRERINHGKENSTRTFELKTIISYIRSISHTPPYCTTQVNQHKSVHVLKNKEKKVYYIYKNE